MLTPVGEAAAIADVAGDAQGRLVAAGSADTADGKTIFALARYLGNGSLDPSFGDGGIVLTDLQSPLGLDQANAVAIQPDGKILVAGEHFRSEEINAWAIVRYHPDGSLDDAFGAGGVVLTAFPYLCCNSGASDVLVQSDGKIVAGGYTSSPDVWDFALARYNPDGTLDPSFGDGGLVVTSLGENVDSVQELLIARNGKLVAVGLATTGPSTGIALARFLPNGMLDSSFGDGGTSVTFLPGGRATGLAGALYAGGRIVAAGSAQGAVGRDSVLARFLPDGTLDESFGDGGVAITPLAGGSDAIADIDVSSDGRIVGAGWAQTESGFDFAVARFDKYGELDQAFGVGGVVTTALSADGSDRAGSLVARGRTVVAAGFAGRADTFDFALARYLTS